MTDYAPRTMRFPGFRRALVAAGLIVTIAPRSAVHAQRTEGQARGSRFVGTDDWMNDAITRLRQRGYLASLNPIAQPWERDAVAKAVARIPVSALDTMPRQAREWLRLLRSELGPELLRLDGRDSLAMGFVAWGGTTMATSPRIDPLFPLREGIAPLNGKARDSRGFWPFGGGAGWAERGHFAAELRLGWDLTLRRADPEGRYPGRLFDVLPDNQSSYVNARFTDGGLVVGRLRRNWAPVGSKGLMISDAAIGMPQIGYDLGGSNVALRGFVAELDTLMGRERYLVAHRVEYLNDDFAISIGESKVYGSRGGPRLSNLNPVEIFFLTGDKVGGEEPTNTALDGTLWWRRGKLTLSGETFLDDVWVQNHAPTRGALSASALYAGPVDFGVDYRAVLSFTYWTVEDVRQNSDQMTYFGRGIGDNFSDYDRWTAHADFYPAIRGLRLTPTIAWQRKGEWDFRRPGLPDSVWKKQRTFLQGVAEKTARVALAGRYQPTRRAFAEWDAGMNFVGNANHVRGKDLSEFSAMLRLGVMWSAPDRKAP